MHISDLKFDNLKIQSLLSIYMNNIFEFSLTNSTKKSSELSGLIAHSLLMYLAGAAPLQVDTSLTLL
jgi:hypothetical protein